MFICSYGVVNCPLCLRGDVHEARVKLGNRIADLRARLNEPVPMSSRVYLTVSLTDKDAILRLGAKFDKDKKRWYADARTEITRFAKWLNNVKVINRDEYGFSELMDALETAKAKDETIIVQSTAKDILYQALDAKAG